MPQRPTPKPGTLGASRAADVERFKKEDEEFRALGETLRQRLSVPGEYPDDIVAPFGGEARVPRAPNFRKPTLAVGTGLARKVEQLNKIAPETRGRVEFVTPAYPSSLVRELAEQANTGKTEKSRVLAKAALTQQFPLTTLGQTTFPKRGPEVFASEFYGDDAEQFDTLAHEYQHVMGARGGGILGANFNREASEEEARTTGQLGGRYYRQATARELGQKSKKK